ncbi:hypothetical protein [Lysobacter gummosus]|uniref:hypothetical protein n=1 Tax=Lysobacter gummosus TaxID=262324 RepID=UPI0036253C18
MRRGQSPPISHALALAAWTQRVVLWMAYFSPIVCKTSFAARSGDNPSTVAS